MKVKQFKIRCSAIGKIMSGTIGLTEVQTDELEALITKRDTPVGLTEKQEEEFMKLASSDSLTEAQSKKLNDLKVKKTQPAGLTPAQTTKLEYLVNKRDNPELPAGVITYCKDWLKGQMFGRRKILDTKYTDKGLINEDEAIDIIAKKLGYHMLFKNEKYFDTDPHMLGTPDILPGNDNTVIDAKNSWSWETFPLLEDEIPNMDYYYQLQGYMALTGRKNALLVYVLTDTPDHLIEREARWYCIRNGYDEMDIQIYNQFHHQLAYQDVPEDLKIKVFEFPRDEDVISEIRLRVVLCREYLMNYVKTHDLDITWTI